MEAEDVKLYLVASADRLAGCSTSSDEFLSVTVQELSGPGAPQKLPLLRLR